MQGDAASPEADLRVAIELREDSWHGHMVQTRVYGPSLALHSTVCAGTGRCHKLMLCGLTEDSPATSAPADRLQAVLVTAAGVS